MRVAACGMRYAVCCDRRTPLHPPERGKYFWIKGAFMLEEGAGPRVTGNPLTSSDITPFQGGAKALRSGQGVHGSSSISFPSRGVGWY